MHISYIHQHFQTLQDKSGTRSYELSKRLIAAGHTVSMISGASIGVERRLTLQGEVTEIEVDGIHVFYINEPYVHKMSFWQRVACFRRFAKKAQHVVEQCRPDLVFATSTPLTVGIPGMKAARHLDVPFVFEIRDVWPELPIEMGIIRNPAIKWYLRRMERQLYYAAQHCIALSPGMVKAIERTGYPEERITMVPNACDLALFKPDRALPKEKWIGDLSCCRFIFSGAHGHANGLDVLIDVAEELKRRSEPGIQLICMGEGGLRAGYIKRTREQGLEEYLLWLDPLPKQQFARLLPTFDVGMMLLANFPAFYEGTSPNKFFDYIACGLPVLNNYPGWLAGMIQENNLGKLIAPENPCAFADACVWFRDHPGDRATMGARSRRFAEEHFSRDLMSQLFVSTLERVGANWTTTHGRRGHPEQGAESTLGAAGHE